ncbi:histidine phosphatase superfamily [Podospora aff. communis PSN243]|uniref:Histidine phosphatase superfamily n=1 Tax=Podospora aff. communis PSN243 TaxID=3040156 RepID=A0AAV9GD75_9PEZI|nr:histidine phosphatase superfamily [Podospora aff. communis PSN243]
MSLRTSKFRFTAVAGFFAQDAATGPHETTTLPGLGLTSRSYETDPFFDPNHQKTEWERFAHYLDHLNKTAPENVSYKLIYAARHGQGYHNVKEAEVGTIEWERHWARLDGDGHTTWADAHLTPKGTDDALAMKTFWELSSSNLKLPLARHHYASPLTRCLQTCSMAFTNLAVAPGVENPPFRPVIKEMIRERLGIHTCDRRSSASVIRKAFPGFSIEEGFSEEDELWVPDVRETLGEHAVRIEAFLDFLFENDEEQIVSVTAHSGSILALWQVIGHEKVRVAPGGIVPVLVKAQVV